MDLQRELPPPSFYLSSVKMGALWLFTDVPIFPESYSSNLTVTPLPGMNNPLVQQGHGNGWVWTLQAKLNPWNKFLAAEDGRDNSGRDKGSNVYDEYLRITQFIEENGPSPLLALHIPGREMVTVALRSFESEMAMQESVPAHNGIGEQFPSTIPVSMTLQRVERYTVRYA